MKYCKVVAILNITDYKALHEPIQYVNDFSPFGFSDNMKVEIYTTAEQAETVAAELSALADRLTKGGGVVAIEPVHQLMNVRKLDCQGI
jgi:nitrogen regulatory protein PII